MLPLIAVALVSTSQALAKERPVDLPLAEVFKAARSAKKPTLLMFSTVWCVPCVQIKKALGQGELRNTLEEFVFQEYDAERGEGVAAAEQYGIHGFPTFVALNPEGMEVARQVGMPPRVLAAWLRATAEGARLSDAELVSRLKESPQDLPLLVQLARRRKQQGQFEDAARLFERAEQADTSVERGAASEAGWERLEIESKRALQADVRKRLEDYAKRYPRRAHKVAPLLAAAGAESGIVEAAFLKAVEQCEVIVMRPGTAQLAAPMAPPQMKPEQLEPSCRLNELVYEALAAGAYEAALAGALKQVEAAPDAANPYDTLAEVYHCRGDKALALEASKKGLGMKASPEELAEMRLNLARFEGGGRLSSLAPPTLAPLLGFGTQTMRRPPPSAELAAKSFFSHEGRTVGRACTAVRAKLEEAYVRVVLGDGEHPSSVEILEPTATPKLRRCLEKGLKAVLLPALTQPATVVFALSLTPPAAPPEVIVF